MTKLLLALGISLGLLNALFAQELDFISLATKGKFNEKSEGVKILNDEEMSKVVGGLYEFGNRIISPTLVSKYYIVQSNDLNYDSGLIREAVGMLYYGEALVYAKRYSNSKLEQTWLIAYDLNTGYSRDLSLTGASSQTLQVLNNKYRY